jgi:hypothetical protein
MPANSTVALSIVDAILKYNASPSTSLPATTVASNCADVSLKATLNDAKANTRASRHEMGLPSMFTDGVEVSFPADSNATDLAAFRTAFFTAAPIPILITDKNGMTPFNAVMYVADFDDTQTLNDVPVDKFSLKVWATGSGGPYPYFG